ncbi:MAG: roadblock/LC7 domain-containing protein [Candidatus Njordarchaeales archaeon]
MSRRRGYKERLEEILDELMASAPEIQGCILVRKDGLLLASSVRERIDKDIIAALSTALLNVANRASNELHSGKLSHIIVAGETGNVTLMDVGGIGVLATVTSKDANIGLLLLEMKRSAEKALKILTEIMTR